MGITKFVYFYVQKSVLDWKCISSDFFNEMYIGQSAIAGSQPIGHFLPVFGAPCTRTGDQNLL